MSINNEISSFIWSVCDDVLRGLFKQHEYGDVILPFVVLRRLDCVLEGKKEDIIKIHEEYKDKFDDTSKIIHSKLNLKFSNYSRYDLKRLKDEPNKLSDNFYDYLSSFSTNVQDIIKNFGLQKHIDKLESNDKLYILVEKFTNINLHPSNVDNYVMGNIFEELLRKFSEMSNETSGEHYTPRDVVNLLVSLVFYSDKEKLSDPNKIISVYDPCCGTGGMLTIGKDWVHKNINKDIDINLFGQELNPQTYSICKSDFLITDEEPDNIKLGSTLTNDQHSDGNRKFDYMITNPPFGVSWKSEQKQIKNESEEYGGRFSVGTPRVSDGSLLFLQHLISKMETNGSRIGIVFNGSPLYVGDGGSGESEIRKWIIENDWLESIVSLPDQLFFNTPLPTYFWILTNKKEERRRGKVQIINGTSFFQRMRKPLGEKVKEITKNNLKTVLDIYNSFIETENSIIVPNDFFGYKELDIKRPVYKDGNLIRDKKGNFKHDKNSSFKEKIKLDEDENIFFETIIKKIYPDSWLNEIKIGYQIDYTKMFYEFPNLETSVSLIEKLNDVDIQLQGCLDDLKNIEIKTPQNLKSSKIDWIKTLPGDWETSRLDIHFNERREKVSDIDYEPLSVTKKGIFKQLENVTKSDNHNDRKKVLKGDFVINSRSDRKGSSGLSRFDGSVSLINTVLTPKNIDGLFSEFLFKSHYFKEEFFRNGQGIVWDLWSTKFSEMRKILIPIPPIEIQKQISDHIIKVTGLIEEIEKLENKKIKLLKELKESMINELISGNIFLKQDESTH